MFCACQPPCPADAAPCGDVLAPSSVEPSCPASLIAPTQGTHRPRPPNLCARRRFSFCTHRSPRSTGGVSPSSSSSPPSCKGGASPRFPVHPPHLSFPRKPWPRSVRGIPELSPTLRPGSCPPLAPPGAAQTQGGDSGNAALSGTPPCAPLPASGLRLYITRALCETRGGQQPGPPKDSRPETLKRADGAPAPQGPASPIHLKGAASRRATREPPDGVSCSSASVAAPPALPLSALKRYRSAHATEVTAPLLSRYSQPNHSY